ncbi:MAG: hypothetical protein CFE39_00695 [Comamonadaceae bacterium PBBC2]|nr:MAG: hypothetical protein CFE39_00695 [Comamonadaceae bacterium PBBC2]
MSSATSVTIVAAVFTLAACAANPHQNPKEFWPPPDTSGARLRFAEIATPSLATEIEEDEVVGIVQEQARFCDTDPWRQFKWITTKQLLLMCACPGRYGTNMALFAVDRLNGGQWRVVQQYSIPTAQTVP